MNWNGPLTVKQFVLILWGSIIAVVLIAGTYHRLSHEPPAEQAAAAHPMPAAHGFLPTNAEELQAKQQEMHDNMDAVKNVQERMQH